MCCFVSTCGCILKLLHMAPTWIEHKLKIVFNLTVDLNNEGLSEMILLCEHFTLTTESATQKQLWFGI